MFTFLVHVDKVSSDVERLDFSLLFSYLVSVGLVSTFGNGFGLGVVDVVDFNLGYWIVDGEWMVVWWVLIDMVSPQVSGLVCQKGGSSDKRKMDEQKPKEQRPKANENKPIMTE
ncbi:hypothetical protein Ddye_001328 [Dipteronia dyeriana]|uniref:Transmembrane protein n=1 Tax=Dipteronia dyeriana TaxID=168575 RepID=A0AAE0CTF0_9ROSI|nr:hypothetical protein Ddye_001328 [Dipteronia dyeriana]